MAVTLQPIRLRKAGWDNTTIEEQALSDGNTPIQKELSLPVSILTNANTGKGVLDALMSSVKGFLNEEYTAQRITGKEYSEVFLGALTVAMQTANQFIATSLQGDEIDAKIGLLRQQTVTELANTDDNIPVGLGFNYVDDGPVLAAPVEPYQEYSYASSDVPTVPNIPAVNVPDWNSFTESPPSVPDVDFGVWSIDDIPLVDSSKLFQYWASLHDYGTTE